MESWRFSYENAGFGCFLEIYKKLSIVQKTETNKFDLYF